VIKKEKNLDCILEILNYEAKQDKLDALNTLGFLYNNGIVVECNRRHAYKYFKRASK